MDLSILRLPQAIGCWNVSEMLGLPGKIAHRVNYGAKILARMCARKLAKKMQRSKEE